MNRTRFTPRMGEIFKLTGTSAEYVCLKIAGKYNAYLQNTKTGWTFLANGIGYYTDGSIDWDFSTDGHFERR